MLRSRFSIFILAVLIFDPFPILADEPSTIEPQGFQDNEKYTFVENKTDTCASCKDQIDGYMSYVRSGVSKSMAKSGLYKLCIMYSDYGPVACKGIVDIEFDTVFYIINNKVNLTGEHVCAIYLQAKGCKDPNMRDWSLLLLPPKPMTDKYAMENEMEEAPQTLKILHLTDFHFDNLYKPGSNAKCNLPLCCQEDSGKPAKAEDAAGYWGDYGMCDIPWHTVLETIEHIKKQHKQIDYIYYTGDIISHVGWKTSREGNTNDTRQLFKLFRDSFGSIPVLPVLGNHEAHPTDFYSPDAVKNISDLSSQWVFDLAQSEWSHWLPNDTSTTIKRGGFYTMLLRPKLRIIALNSNVCYVANLWLLYDDVDPYDQLLWLVIVLMRAEENGEYVHILTHIPPGSVECHKIWMRQYIKIVNRFSKTIQAQFTGHTHQDELRVFYDEDNPKKVSNLAFNGASLTTFVGFNPNYRIYDVNSKTYEVTNYEEWIFNLTEANSNGSKSPRFYKLYSFVEDYNLGTLTRENVGKLIERMYKNDTLKHQYYRYLIRDSDFYLQKGCDKKCLDSYFCAITNLYVEDALKC